jgi:hypothetical protein
LLRPTGSGRRRRASKRNASDFGESLPPLKHRPLLQRRDERALVEIAGAIEAIALRERRVPLEATVGHGHVKLSDETRPVDNDDVVWALLKFESGCQGLFSVSRVMTGLAIASGRPTRVAI